MTIPNKGDSQPSLFGSVESLEVWRTEWRGMPEFIQEDLSPYKSIIVHFANPSDMAAFIKLTGQILTPKTQSIWYPTAAIGRYANKRYIRVP